LVALHVLPVGHTAGFVPHTTRWLLALHDDWQVKSEKNPPLDEICAQQIFPGQSSGPSQWMSVPPSQPLGTQSAVQFPPDVWQQNSFVSLQVPLPQLTTPVPH
jgi:hypothetical protein